MSGSSTFPTQNVFAGFDTHNALLKRNTSLYDVALIERDMRNAFCTRIGERIMRPNYGCAIWNYFMEPLTDQLRTNIVNEAVRVVQLDSRVSVQNVMVYQLNQGVRVEIYNYYVPFAVYNTFFQSFEERQTNYIQGPSQ